MPNYSDKELLKGYPKITKLMGDAIRSHCGRDAAIAASEDAPRIYADIMPQVPYIGGGGNPLTSTLVFSAQVLSFIVALTHQGEGADRIGTIIHDAGQAYARSFSPLLAGLARLAFFSPLRLAGLGKRAKGSKIRQYAGDWVFDLTCEKGRKREYRLDYHECGIHKLYRQLGYEEYVKFLCRLDFVIAGRIGVRLERDKTIADGDSVCNFRYTACNAEPIGIDHTT